MSNYKLIVQKSYSKNLYKFNKDSAKVLSFKKQLSKLLEMGYKELLRKNKEISVDDEKRVAKLIALTRKMQDYIQELAEKNLIEPTQADYWRGKYAELEREIQDRAWKNYVERRNKELEKRADEEALRMVREVYGNININSGAGRIVFNKAKMLAMRHRKFAEENYYLEARQKLEQAIKLSEQI